MANRSRGWPPFTYAQPYFLESPPINKRAQPASGVNASLRNALMWPLVAAMLFGFPLLLIDLGLNEAMRVPLLSLVNILPLAFTWFGGLAWCQHWALRFVIYRQGWLPFRLIPWLNAISSMGILRRVGGGYIFIHRSLLEYFAAMKSE